MFENENFIRLLEYYATGRQHVSCGSARRELLWNFQISEIRCFPKFDLGRYDRWFKPMESRIAEKVGSIAKGIG